jgi:hypothetical protein
MAKKNFTAAKRLVNEQMLAMLEWAAKHPARWHDIGKIEATQRRGRAARKARRDRDEAADESIQAQASWNALSPRHGSGKSGSNQHDSSHLLRAGLAPEVLENEEIHRHWGGER